MAKIKERITTRDKSGYLPILFDHDLGCYTCTQLLYDSEESVRDDIGQARYTIVKIVKIDGFNQTIKKSS